MFVKWYLLSKAGGGMLYWTDFQVGSDIALYGRVFRVTGADEFSRKYCEE